ncbi:MAG: LLM class flavin-dependent oxidoreductase [Acidimicrobiales bacterium]
MGGKPAAGGNVDTVVAHPPLSVLDVATVADGSSASQALAETTEVAREVERLGYRRLWVAEHHGMPAVASSAPAVLLAHVAAATSTIRVGSGGVMLPNHAPLVIAEQFGTLEALHPGRVDLGIGRAPGTDALTARALRRTADLGAERFPDDLVELIGYFTGAVEHPRAMPGVGYLPEVWLLGSSLFSAELAGLLGLPFSFAHHFNPRYTEPALDRYRQAFRPSAVCEAPHAMVAVAVVCAPAAAEAQWLAGSTALSTLFLRTNRLTPLPSPETAAGYAYTPQERELVDSVMATHVVGEPDAVRDGLDALVARTGADELMLTTRVHDPLARRRSFELVADAWRDIPG